MRPLAKIAVYLSAISMLAGAAYAADPPKPLDVPYLSQFWAATDTIPASQRNSNCAPSAVEMAAAYAQNREAKIVNIIELNKLMGRKDPIKGGPTKHSEARDAGKKLYKLPIEYKRMGLEDALKEVAAGGPVVVGIIYGDISTRWDQHCTGGHTLVLVGADAKSVIVNDPDDKSPDHKGKSLHYDRAEFEKAMKDFGNACLVGFRKTPETPAAPGAKQ
jgi:hypothetical protein